jgi:hypothetical protein
MSAAQARRKVIHRAGLIDRMGNVSAKCFKRPKAIDLSVSSWTLLDHKVTCLKCLTAMGIKS